MLTVSPDDILTFDEYSAASISAVIGNPVTNSRFSL
jgi:hypothetical protein